MTWGALPLSAFLPSRYAEGAQAGERPPSWASWEPGSQLLLPVPVRLLEVTPGRAASALCKDPPADGEHGVFLVLEKDLTCCSPAC